MYLSLFTIKYSEVAMKNLFQFLFYTFLFLTGAIQFNALTD
jgi:hypothetical protein